MKANNLSISIPNNGCDKHCPYCVSVMTPKVKIDENLFYKNLSTVKKLADLSQVMSVSLTGKGEPMLNVDSVARVLSEFRDSITELQTNGIYLEKNVEALNVLSAYNLNVLAISIDRLKQFESLVPVVAKASSLGIVTRATVNVTDMIDIFENPLESLILKAKKVGFNQFSFRQITVPKGCWGYKTAQWIEQHAKEAMYYSFVEEFDVMDKTFIRSLNYGAKVYEVLGMSVTHFDYCIQDSTNGEDLRSLIYQQDGHCYTSWNNTASILF